MAEQDNRSRSDRPLEDNLYRELDTPWDVEAFLQNKTTTAAPPRSEETQRVPSERREPERVYRMPEEPRPRKKAPPRKKTRVNVRGWAILIGICLAALLVLVGLIFLVVSLFSTDAPQEDQTLYTSPTVESVSREEILNDILARADRLAMSYDYDGAVAVLAQYGSDWLEQPELSQAKTRYQTAQSTLEKVADTRDVTFLSFRSLIADTKRAFDGDEDAESYNQYHVTISEFNAILESLYAGGYVLVRPHDLFTTKVDDDGKQTYEQGEIYLPAGKKLLVIVQDDVNYYASMVDSDGDGLADAGGDGFAYRLAVDADGNLTCDYIGDDGKESQGDYDLVPILESFVEEHPDFSYRGAKGVVTVTGSEGVFGYHTHPDWKAKLGESSYAREVEMAQNVAACLKANGWEIACHTYAHISYGDSDAAAISADVSKWETEVQTIVGDTDLLFYPIKGGLYEYSGSGYEAMQEAGYRFYCTTATEANDLRLLDGYIRISRRLVGGYWLVNEPETLKDLFDAKKLVDEVRPTPVLPIS